MIHLISNRSLPWDSKKTLSDINPPETIQLDIETTGLCAWTNQIISVQIGYGGEAFVIDTKDFDFTQLKWLENHTCIGHNIKFDLLFLRNKGIIIEKVWDTYLAERLLTNGKFVKRDLGSVAKRYLGVDLDKDVRDKLAVFGLNHQDCIEYSGKDVLYLEEIAKKQVYRLKDKKMFTVAKDEMANVPAFTYMEQCGFYLNKEEWLAAESKGIEIRDRLVSDLHKSIIDLVPEYENLQGDLFSHDVKSTVLWSSPKQVSDALHKAGIITEGSSVAKDEIGHISHPIIGTYLKYKAQDKLCGTYGSNFLNHVKSDGRIRTNFKLLVNTGRTSSSPNLQNIPSYDEPEDDVFRHAFQAEEGNMLLVNDYSGQESVILADRSKEPNLLDFYLNGGADLHSYVARLVWPDELGELTLDVINKEHSGLRKKAKSTTFALAYGASASSVGQEVYDRFMKAFPGLFEYFDMCEQRTLEDGYITINEKSGMKFYIDQWEYFLDLQRKMDNSWWADYRKAKGTHRFEKMNKMKKDFYAIGGAIRRKSMNYPIQGTAAHQKKRALRKLYEFLRNYNLIPSVKICVEVHDELVVECPSGMADRLAPKIQEIMEDAANYYLDKLTMKASPVITKYWNH